MKRVTITPQIEQHVRNALGQDADLNSVAVFEAIAFNTLPIRKRHPLYNKAVADRSLLREMAAALSAESLPVRIEHMADGALPLGRVFHGEVLDNGSSAELRVLFFLSTSEQEAVLKVDNGTVDQVSVSVVPKHLYSSATGFDFLGPDSTFDNIWEAVDDQGNKMGENGVYGRMVGLDSFFEMSLVGQGGAQNARIVRRDQSHFGSSYQKLAASGVDPNALVLTASATIEDSMDLTTLVTQLTDTKVELSAATAAKTTLEAQVASLNSEKTVLETRIAELGDPAATVAEKDAQVATLTSEKEAAVATRDAAVLALQSVAQKLLTASGKVDAEVPTDVAELTALIEDTKAGLAAVLVAGGKSDAADGGTGEDKTTSFDNSAFRSSRATRTTRI